MTVLMSICNWWQRPFWGTQIAQYRRYKFFHYNSPLEIVVVIAHCGLFSVYNTGSPMYITMWPSKYGCKSDPVSSWNQCYMVSVFLTAGLKQLLM